MNTSESDLINKTFYPGWLMVSQLRCGQPVTDGEALFFSTLNAGEELWERIRQLLREPTADAAVLTCFYRTLQLGFVGQYRAEDDERREDVAQALGARVPPFSMTQEAPVVVRASRLRSGRRMYWCGWVAGIVALAALWLTFSSVLSQMVAQIAGQG
ncbi:DotU family type IV/VI secretion system protein [Klebsiella pneumoniae]